MNHRITGRRLAAALVTLATVTAVTGTLVTAPAAVAAPAGATAEGRCAPSADGLLPVGAEVASTGAFGYMTTCVDENGTTVIQRHALDGTVSTYTNASAVYDSSSDWLVTNSNGVISAYHPVSKTYSNHVLSGDLVGVAFNVVYESRPAANGVGRELWQLRNDNGVVNKMKISDSFGNQMYQRTETGYKIVAAGRDADGRATAVVLVQGTRATNDGPVPYSTHAVIPVPLGTEIPTGSVGGSESWDASATGALTPTYRAWTVNRPDGGTQLTAMGNGPVKHVPLTDIPGKAVLAGIIGHTALYAAQRDPYAGPEVVTPLYARNLATGGAPYKVLENFSSVAHAPDGSLLARGATSEADGLFALGKDGTTTPTLVASTGRLVALDVTRTSVPSTVSLEKGGVNAPMTFDLNRPDATVTVVLTHTRTGKTLTARAGGPGDGNRFTYSWNGVLGGLSAPNGAYTWQATATTLDGAGTDVVSGAFTVTRSANLHDFNDNGSTDVLARDAAGVLWRDDLYDWPVDGQVKPAERTRIGSGWNTYKKIEAAGTINGGATGDLIAVDSSGVLWSYTGKGDGTFAGRVRVGGGWGVYTQLAAGSDWQTADRSSDLFAADTSGVLWYYRATGDAAKPYFPRVRVGGGWGVYNQITAVGNIVGDVGGELVARDKDGVLWLYQSNGFTFLPRVRIGGGWGGFSQLVGAGDVTADGRPDLIAYGPGGTYVYRSTGTTTSPFSRQNTTLYAGEGGKFGSVA
ncbi:FG-GAP repeat domain-containing protein [Streptomyces sp. NPDC085460]|uniref:FG-GAP repeat domain-containing protein n=1 Tax=Streptomyces sp. NPDC085460 TaxID=3365723 RepID=UPI0037D45F52